MILSVHAIFGAFVASQIPDRPIMAFGLGFASHFILDAIPHVDYKLLSLDFEVRKEDSNNLNFLFNKFRLIRDIFLMSLDFIGGLLLAFLFFFNPAYPLAFLLGVSGALLPDFLTFLWIIIKHKSLRLFYNLHANFFHSKTVLGLGQITGVCLQFVTLIVLVAILFKIKYLLT